MNITEDSSHEGGTVTTAEVRWVDGERFVTSGSSGHGLVLDSDRNSNNGPGPMELVLQALCGCTATDVIMILKKKRQLPVLLEVSARGERAKEPPTVFTRIHLRYRFSGSDLERGAVERAVELSQTKYCSVYLMLHKTVAIDHEILIEPA